MHSQIQEWSDCPQTRYNSRVEFYKKYGFSTRNHYGYGNAELAFLRWAISRGVLNHSENDEKPGSLWWKKIHDRHLFYSESAAAKFEQNPGNTSPVVPVQMWLDYFKNPNVSSWYRAHNSSIIQGFLDSRNEAYKETDLERWFINIVLSRLLFAQVLVERKTVLGKFARWVADPQKQTIDYLVNKEGLYPTAYPLKNDLVNFKRSKACQNADLMKIFDKKLIMPRVSTIYEHCALLNNSPSLVKFLKGNTPIYPDML